MCNFNGIIDVTDDGPAGGLDEMCGALKAKGWWQVSCHSLNLVFGWSTYSQHSQAMFRQISKLTES